ncbi:MAG: serine/threonine protein kinase [Betaproteobacteria bacterium]|nr:serine/threonine protein kinase [Betaproteobacteria bacterium]
MKISPETWKKIDPLLTAALDMTGAERGAWLEGLRTSHPEEAPILARMLATHERAERDREMETVPQLAPLPAPSSAFAEGDRVGPFRLVRPIGRGGMGEVWLAEQADGRVTRQVALKLPSSLEANEIRAERFQRERDILAKLAHPNIARLYDAGVSESGQPYLAMEYVAGEALDKQVAALKLPIAARLALLRQVLSAVSHAHRHLVVHRDLKPANILIDASGQVKLLDFGIAKLVEDETVADTGARRDLTRLGGRVMTLRYAAPEQVAEGAVTTATDIYSLGVILHELVTGEAPYRALREGKPLTDVMLLQEEIAVASSLPLAMASALERGLASSRQLARAVAGDLDAIILKALRRDPAARYASVELFDEDIARHLDRRPVKARAGTWRYLAGRFAVRHRLPIAMAATVIVTMAVGLVMAEHERRVAVVEKARAERHFTSVRKLANAFIFDVNAEIENLPGSLKAREMLVKTSLDYLDALQAEAGNDPALMFELAAAYRKIGDVQGLPGGANTGDLSAAIGNFEKGRRLFVALDALRPDDINSVREHWNLSYNLAKAYFMKDDSRWEAEIASAVVLAERAAALPGATPGDRARSASTLSEQALLGKLLRGPSQEVEAVIRRSISILESLAREAPGDATVRDNLILTYERAGKVLSSSGRPAAAMEGVEYYRKVLVLIRGVMAANPNDRKMAETEQSYLTQLSVALSQSGQLLEADRTIAEAVDRGAELVARDPKNVAPAMGHLGALNTAALIAYRMGDHPRTVRFGREALAVAARIPEDTQKTRDWRGASAEAKALVGAALLGSAGRAAPDRGRQLAMLTEARSLLADAVAFVDQLRAEKLDSKFVKGADDEIRDALKHCDEALAKLARA